MLGGARNLPASLGAGRSIPNHDNMRCRGVIAAVWTGSGFEESKVVS